MLRHEHFGKVRAKRHTSYASLVFLLLVAGVLLLGVSLAADAASPAVNPQSGSIGLTGRVTGPPPGTAATISRPADGSTTSTIPLTVSGSCPLNTFVSVDRNNVFAGATTCQDDGTYSLLVDLFDGQNTLVVKVSDALGQFGPDSKTITVFYNAPSLQLPSDAVGKQLFIQTATTVAGVDPGVSLTRQVTLVGGVGPYAVSWDWGDGQTSLSSQAAPGGVSSSHTYDRPGTYTVIIRVTDSTGNSAYLQVITVVNGPITPLGATKGSGLGSLSGTLLTAWPLYLMAIVMIAFFWLGERRELHKLRKRHLVA